MEDLGSRIRDERQKHELPLEVLSQKTELSISFLSQIERSLAQPWGQLLFPRSFSPFLAGSGRRTDRGPLGAPSTALLGEPFGVHSMKKETNQEDGVI